VDIDVCLHPASLAYGERSIDSARRIEHAATIARALGLALLEHDRLAERELLELVCDREHLAGLEAQARLGPAPLDPELQIDAAIWKAARASASLLVEAVARALERPRRALLCLSRPGSHHASADESLGACLLNNLALAARYALCELGLERAAIVDIDAHHGNGTQEIFAEDGAVLVASCHEFPFYPGTGAHDERGRGAGLGATLNLPLAAKSGNGEFLAACARIARAVRSFRPQLLLVEAGLDGHVADWTSSLRLDERAYFAVGSCLAALAEECSCPLVVELGGGYTDAARRLALPQLLRGLRDGRCELAGERAFVPACDTPEPAELLLGELRASNETLYASYPYAARLGRELAARRPDLYREFVGADPVRSAWPSGQARAYAFLGFAEARRLRTPIDDDLVAILRAGPPFLRRELRNTIEWFRRG
jgi:acetoin utilization deacetylase AcuC-like enzyme